MIPPQNVPDWKYRVAPFVACAFAAIVIALLTWRIFMPLHGMAVATETPIRTARILVQDAAGVLLFVGCDGGVTTPQGSLLGSLELAKRWEQIMSRDGWCPK